MTKESNTEADREIRVFLRETLGEILLKVGDLHGEFKEFKAIQIGKEKNTNLRLDHLTERVSKMDNRCSNLQCRDHSMGIKNLKKEVKDNKDENEKQNDRFNNILINILKAGLGAIVSVAVAVLIWKLTK